MDEGRLIYGRDRRRSEATARESAIRTILVFNCGSSSLGCKLYGISGGLDPWPLFSAKAHRVGVTGTEPSYLQAEVGETIEKVLLPLPDHRTAARHMLEDLRARGLTMDWVGHRFAHGGEAFTGPVVIDDTVLGKLKECASLAPIHNPPTLSVIHECSEILPGHTQYVAFDTAFHASLPEQAYTYPVPRVVRERFHYRRYGFHGLSYSYVAEAAPPLLGLRVDKTKMVLCHLGTGGSSVCAVAGGRSLDTSMGYSPLTGLLMSTRCGDIDPMLALYLLVAYDMHPDDALTLLTNGSGLLGVTGFSSDLRDIIDDPLIERRERADLAFHMYTHRLKKYVGSYVTALGGVDALVFTDDIGLTNWRVREEVCADMGWCGVELDPEANRRATDGSVALISTAGSAVGVLAIPNEEELVIAREGMKLMLGEASS